MRGSHIWAAVSESLSVQSRGGKEAETVVGGAHSIKHSLMKTSLAMETKLNATSQRNVAPASRSQLGKIPSMMQNIQKGSDKTNRKEIQQSDSSLKTKICWHKKQFGCSYHSILVLLVPNVHLFARNGLRGLLLSFKTFFINSGWWHPFKNLHSKDSFKEFVQNIFFATKSILELYYLTKGCVLSHTEICYPIFFLLLHLLSKAESDHL